MYCYQCGEKLIEGANFCHVCGADQSVVKKIEITGPKGQDDNLQKSHLSKDDTKVFYLSGESEEEDLNLYLSKVDSQIRQNIEEFEEKESLEEDSNKELLQKSKSSPITKPQKKKKKSFKQIWKDFINEEDNPYSVFGELSQDDDLLHNDSKENILLSNEIKNDGISSTNSTSETGDYKGMASQVNALIEEEDGKKAATAKGPSLKDKLKSFFAPTKDKISKAKVDSSKENTSEDHFITDLKLQDALDSEEKNDTEKKNKFFKKNSYSSPKPVEKKDSSFANQIPLFKKKVSVLNKDHVDHTLTEADSRSYSILEEKTTTAVDSEKHNKEEESQQKMVEKTNSYNNTEETKSSSTRNSNRNPLSRIQKIENNANVNLLSNRYSVLRRKITSESPTYLALTFGLGIILSVLPIFIIQKSIGFSPILLSILKILISLAAFYFANQTARNYCIDNPSKQTLNIDTVIHWTISQVPLFIIFFLLPRNIVMGHNLLGALTPHFITSILLYILAMGLSFVSVFKQLSPYSYLEYFGWFSIIFILIELFSKLFWVIVTFMSTALL